MERSDRRPEVTRGEVAGVPTFFHEAPLPYWVGLLFRVGRADETLPTSGITHIVEHLALTGLGEVSYDFNGEIGPALTTFSASGSAEDVEDFLQRLVASLTKLPLERLDAELEILRTERGSHMSGPPEAMLAIRYGARGYGLMGSDEFGLNNMGPDQVITWTGRWFCARNAALWMSGPRPFEAELSLPAGARVRPPAAEPLPLRLPAWIGMRQGAVGASFRVPRVPAASLLASVVERRAVRQLRHALAVAYQVNVAYVPLDTDTAEMAVWADCLSHNAVKVHESLRRLLDELVEQGPTTAELDADRQLRSRWWGSTEQVCSLLDSHATDELSGLPWLPYERVNDELEQVGPGDVSAALGDALPTGIYLVPDDVELSTSPLPPLEPVVSAPVEGRRLWPAGGGDVPPGAHLRVGDRGVSLVLPRSQAVTVAFDDCAVLLRSPNGHRVLIGVDNSSIDVDPQVWAGARGVASLIDAGVTSERHVDVEALPPDGTARQRVNWRGFTSGALFLAGLLVMLVDYDAGWHRPLSPGGLLFFGTLAVIMVDLFVSLWRWRRWESGRW